MELSRRDLAKALGAVGLGFGAGIGLRSLRDGGNSEDTQPGPFDEADLETLVAVAQVVYPSAVDGVESFVRPFMQARASARPEHAREVAAAIEYLDTYSETLDGLLFRDLSSERQAVTLNQMGADAADPDPNGSEVERVRYYLVNDLLFALYSTPTGGELVGTENPMGHPGGIQSYQRGPQV
ncbi:MAG: gluconate 2-dehydrogenase subunit 3 family protein [Halobacteriales archaeon]|nr:gluconate 2-dehydrogenase subunit 3 family protein [Halobacteriales archaeon]